MTKKRSVEAGTAGMVRRLLETVERGELEADGERGVALVLRMEGAALALEALDTGPRDSRSTLRPESP